MLILRFSLLPASPSSHTLVSAYVSLSIYLSNWLAAPLGDSQFRRLQKLLLKKANQLFGTREFPHQLLSDLHSDSCDPER